MNKIKLALCDDITSLVNYFKREFEKEDAFEVVGTATDSNECVSMVEKTMPDVLLLDIQMEANDSGLNIITKIKEVSPKTKIIIFTIHEEDDYIFKSFSLGVSDYIVKTTPMEEITSSILAVHQSENQFIRTEFARIIASELHKMRTRQDSLLYVITLLSKLSPSEFDILKKVYDGYTYAEIAKERYVEELTIRSQSSHILKKFNTKKMKELISELKDLKVFEVFVQKGDNNDR